MRLVPSHHVNALLKALHLFIRVSSNTYDHMVASIASYIFL